VKIHPRKTIISTGALFALTVVSFLGAAQAFRTLNDFWGPRYQPALATAKPSSHPRPHPNSPANRVRHWNEIAINASGIDHTPPAAGENRIFGEQFGPTRASRAIAIVQIAIFEAVNAIDGSCRSYVGLGPARADTSMECAIAQAACDTLDALFPSQQSTFNQELAAELSQTPDNRPKADGIALGHRAASAILALRTNDGSQTPEPQVGVNFSTSNDPGKWRRDPISRNSLALGAYWGLVQPFVLQSSSQFRAPTPPALSSAEYAAAFNEVKSVGGDGVLTSTTRTAEETQIGIYWAYDGTPSLCAPPRLYNQIAMHIADQMGTSSDAPQLARLLALTNVAMADAAIAIWEAKYYYQYWRPVTGIRESDPNTGPTDLGDRNSATVGDPNFSPLGAPASNLNGPNFTPPFPSYPSGHGGFGGALFETLRKFYGTDQIAFTFTSDEFNGVTRDNTGTVRPLMPRSFCSLSQAEEENGQSRIYLGIHWAFDKTEAIAQGRRVADYVFANAFAPLSQGNPHGK
jgi:PAP2 superfamily